ncbi:hypothetical protein BDZ89DRAFT_231661 [Hymenopellis radicata]|nr:hypothetical protein BDZ89DRAFT_231661 [Hymenopellis radicata]
MPHPIVGLASVPLTVLQEVTLPQLRRQWAQERLALHPLVQKAPAVVVLGQHLAGVPGHLSQSWQVHDINVQLPNATATHPSEGGSATILPFSLEVGDSSLVSFSFPHIPFRLALALTLRFLGSDSAKIRERLGAADALDIDSRGRRTGIERDEVERRLVLMRGQGMAKTSATRQAAFGSRRAGGSSATLISHSPALLQLPVLNRIQDSTCVHTETSLHSSLAPCIHHLLNACCQS